MTTQTEALKLALEALDGLYLPNELARVNKAITAIKEALAQPEPKYTTTRNAWTGTATHKCNQCGREDFRSEHAAKFHKCEAVGEPEPHSQDRWLDIQLPDTTPPQRKPLTDEQIDEAIQQHVDPVATYRKLHDFARAIEAAHGITASEAEDSQQRSKT